VDVVLRQGNDTLQLRILSEHPCMYSMNKVSIPSYFFVAVCFLYFGYYLILYVCNYNIMIIYLCILLRYCIPNIKINIKIFEVEM
jgi:hypothetical protein